MLKAMRSWLSFWNVVRAWRSTGPARFANWRAAVRPPRRSRRPSTRRQRGLFAIRPLGGARRLAFENCEVRQMLTGTAAIVVPPWNTSPPSNSDEAVQIDLAADLSGFTSSTFTYAWTVTKNSVPYDSGTASTFSFTPDDDGSYAVTLEVVGIEDSEFDDDGCGITIDNVAPTADAGGPYTVVEGGTVGLVGDGTDIPADELTYAWDLDGDGDFETSGRTPEFNATGVDGPDVRTISLRVSDGDGGVRIAYAELVVLNSAPSIEPLDLYTVAEGSTIGLSAEASDPGVDDLRTAREITSLITAT